MDEKKKSKGNKLILIVLLLLVLAAGGATVLVLLGDNLGQDKEEVETVLSKEEAIQMATAVSDAETLRELLLLDMELSINVTEDVEIDETFIVNGTKTLYGTAKILAQKKPFEDLSAFEVANGATLIVDGLVIDGNGMANGIVVNEGATLQYLSGEIVYTTYGIWNEGLATVEAGTIKTATMAAIYAAEKGETYVNGGEYLNAGTYFFKIDASASLEMNEGAVLKGALSSGIYNEGTLAIYGGSISDTVLYGIQNCGKMTTKYKGSKKDGYIEISETQQAAVYNRTSQDCVMEDIHAVGGGTNNAYISNYDVEELGTMTYKNCLFENAGGNAMSVIGKVEMYNVSIISPTTQGLYVRCGGDVYMEDCYIENTGSNAIHMEGGTVSGKSVKIVDTQTNAFSVGNGTDADKNTVIGVVDMTGLEISGTKSNNFNIRSAGASVTLKNSVLGKSERTNLNAKEGSKVVLNNVKLLGTGAEDVGVIAIGNDAAVEANKVSITGAAGAGVIVAKGSFKVNDVTIEGTKGHAMNINGGTVSGKTLKITDTEKTALQVVKSGDVIGKVDLTDVEITGTKVNNLDARDKCEVTLKDAVLGKSVRTNVNAKDGTSVVLHNVKLLGTEAEDVAVIGIGKDAVVEVNKVSIEGAAGHGINMAGGTVSGKTLKITDTEKTAIQVVKSGDVIGKVDLTDVEITGTKVNNLDARDKCEVTLTDAVLGKSVRTNVNAKDGSIVKLNNVKLLGTEAEDVGVIGIGKDAVLEANKVSIEDAAGAGVILLKGNFKVNDVTIEETKGLAVRVVGGTVSGKTLKITDAQKTALQVEKSGDVIGKVDLTDVEITGTKVNNLDVRDKCEVTLTDAILGKSVRTNLIAKSGTKKVTLKNVELLGTEATDVAVLGIEPDAVVEANKVSVTDAAGTAVNVIKGTLKVNDVSIEDTTGHGISMTGGTVSGTTLKITDTTKTAIQVVKSGDVIGKVELADVEITGTKVNNLDVREDCEVTLTDSILNKSVRTNVIAKKGGTITLDDVEVLGSEATDIPALGVDPDAAVELLGDTKITDGGLRGVNVYGTLTMQDGSICNHDLKVDGAGVYVFEGGVFNMNGGAIYGNQTTKYGAGVYVAGTLNTSGGSFYDNASATGGAIYVLSGTSTIENTTFTGNSSTASGGAIRTGSDVTLNMTNNMFEGNTAAGNGGAVNFCGGTLAVTDCTFISNSTSGGTGGGALTINDGSEATLTWTKTDSEEVGFSGNSAPNGGAMYCNNATVTISGYTYQDNTAKSTGGALYLRESAVVTITDAKFKNNENEGGSGGAIWTASPNAMIKDTEFSGNIATSAGGAIACTKNNNVSGVLTVTDCVFDANTAGAGTSEERDGTQGCGSEGGGAVSITGGSTVTFTKEDGTCEFKNNKTIGTSQLGGGAIYTNNAKVSVDGYAFNNNATTKDGGAIYVKTDGNAVTVKNATFTGNTAQGTYADGAITGGTGNAAHTSKTLKLDNCTFDTNGVVVLNGANGKAEISNEITGATFVYTQSATSLMIGEAGITPISTITITPIYTPETKVVGGTDSLVAAAIEKIAVTQPKDAAGVWSLGKDGTLIYSIPTEASDLATTISNAPGGSIIYVSGNATIAETITIDKNITLKTVGENTVTLTRGATTAMFNVASGKAFTIDGAFTLDGNKANYTGTQSLIINAGTTTLGADVTVQNAKATALGAAFHNSTSSSVANLYCDFIGNVSSTSGGAVRNEKGTINVEGSLFDGNKSLNDAQNGGGSGGAISGYGTLVVKNSIFRNNIANQNGGAIHSGYSANGSTSIYGCKFENNTASYGRTNDYKGAGAIMAECTLTIDDYVVDGKVVITTKFYNNTAAQHGGAIRVNSGSNKAITCTISGSTLFDTNTITGGSALGGAICNTGNHPATIDITGATFTGNTAKNGGALYIDVAGTVVTATDCVFGYIDTKGTDATDDDVNHGNTATTHGGAIYMANGTLKLLSTTEDYADSKFEGNKSGTASSGDGKGGAVYVNKGTLYVGYDGNDDTTEYGYAFSSNESKYHGGAVSLDASAVVVINDADFTGNKSGNSKNGGAINSYSNDLTVMNTSFTTNTAAAAGGAIIANGSKKTTIENCTFKGNTAMAAGESGGAVKAESATMTIEGCTFEANESKSTNHGGGAVFVKNSKLTVTDTTFKSNVIQSNALGGGAIYIMNSGTSNVSIKGNSSFSNNGSTDIYKAKSSDPLAVDAGITYKSN